MIENEFKFKIKPNDARIEEKFNEENNVIFLSNELYNKIPDIKNIFIYCEFYSIVNNQKIVYHKYIIKSNNITNLNFNHNDYHYADKNYEGIDYYSRTYVYDVLLGMKVYDNEYTHSDAYIVFQSKKELAKFKLKLNNDFL